MKVQSSKVAVLALTASLSGQTAVVSGQSSTVKEKQDVVFACNLNAMTKEQRKRQSRFLTPALHSHRLAAKEVADGYEFQFPSDAHTLQLVAEWIGNERLCCPFFTFEIQLKTGAEPMVLYISGPEGVKEFIRAEIPALVG